MVWHLAGITIAMILLLSRDCRILQVPDCLTKRRAMALRCRINKLLDAQIFSETDIEHSVSVFRNIKIIGIQHLKIHIISSLIEESQEVLNSLSIAGSQHSRYILSHEEERLLIFQYTDVIIKELTSCIIDALQRPRLAPRLTGRTADDTINIIREIRWRQLPDVSLDEMNIGEIGTVGGANLGIKLICSNCFKTSFMKTEVQSTCPGK